MREEWKHFFNGIKALLLALSILASNAVLADPFLEPQVLPAELRQLNFEDQKTGKSIQVNLDESYLPIKQDFFDDEVAIPFYIQGLLVDSSSGNKLVTWQAAPKENSNGISILLLHGNGGNILSNLGGVIALAKKGFRVSIVDYSGYGWSEGKATRDNVLADALSTLDVIHAQANADGEKLVLYGQSLGGHLAVVVASEQLDQVDAVAIEGAFSSHKAIAATHKGGLAKVFVSEPYSAMESISGYTKPLLVIHSGDDEIVPISHGQELFEAANEPKEFMEIDQAHLAGLALYIDPIAEKITEMVR